LKKISLLLLSLAVALSMLAAPAFADPWKDESGKQKNRKFQLSLFGDDLRPVQSNKQAQKIIKQVQKQHKNAAKHAFKDIQKHWAISDIERVQDLGFISGYPDGTFKPNSSLTSAEAVAIATRLADRLYGDLDVDEDIDEISNIPDWARGAVMKACALNMINMNRFHSHVQASRAQVAVMLAKALKLDPVDTGDIPFKDGLLISKEDLGYILALYKEGYISGMPNGKFNPNSGITRAEFAAILARIAADLEDDPVEDDKEDLSMVSGTIYDLTNDKDDAGDWTIELKDGEEYNVDEDVKVFDAGGDETDYWRLEENDEVAVLYIDDDDVVREIYLAETDEGVIEELDQEEITVDGNTYEFPADFEIDEYMIGSEVVVYIHNEEVLKIDILEDEDDITVPGEVKAINGDSWYISIKQTSGNQFIFDVREDVVVEDDVDGDDLDFNDLDTGWEVELILEDNEVEKIVVVDK